MKIAKIAACSALALTAIATASIAADAPHANSYAGQQAREIKALAPDEVQNFLSGKGMGLAKAAELNGYPGPSHVLALGAELGLNDEQKQKTEALFKSMEQNAKEAGRGLIDEERKLDQLFATKAVSADSLKQSLARIGAWQAKVRQAHLEAHLSQTAILTPQQVQTYMALRGYAAAEKPSEHVGHQH